MDINLKKEDIDDFINNKITICSLAKKYNVYRDTLSNYLNEKNIKNKQIIIEEEDIKKYLNKEQTIKELASKYSISENKFYYILIKLKKQRKNFINEKEIIDYYIKDNFTLKDIRKKTKLSEELIKKILLKNNVELKTKSEKINLEECINMYYEGFKFSIIAKKFNVHPYTIVYLLKKNNIYKKVLGNYNNKKRSFNVNSVFFFKYFDKLNNTNGLYGDKEFYIKELNYFLDYINFDLKIIIEWDEINHKYKKDLDKKRENEIKKIFPDFEFKRIQE